MNRSDSDALISHSIMSIGGLSIENNDNIDTTTAFLHDDPMLDMDLRLQSGSPAINAGLNQAIASSTDLDGKTRLIGSSVDMGAYEYGEDDNCNDQNVFLHPQSFVDEKASFTTDQLIYATNKIVSTDITYDALLGVELGLQFEVASGALFEAALDGCP